jgi:hypothetical protein
MNTTSERRAAGDAGDVAEEQILTGPLTAPLRTRRTEPR